VLRWNLLLAELLTSPVLLAERTVGKGGHEEHAHVRAARKSGKKTDMFRGDMLFY
jgi:hypothetical protein